MVFSLWDSVLRSALPITFLIRSQGRYESNSSYRGSLPYWIFLHVGVLVKAAGTTGFYKRGVAQCWVPSTQGTTYKRSPYTYLLNHIIVPSLQLPSTNLSSVDKQTNPITNANLISNVSLFNNGSQGEGGQR